jgi:hypothetical protein
MNRRWLVAGFFLAAAAVIGSAGCHESASTCESVCQAFSAEDLSATAFNGTIAGSFAMLPGGACAEACEAAEAAEGAAGRAGDFQTLLTCIGDEGTSGTLCTSIACDLSDPFSVPICRAGGGYASTNNVISGNCVMDGSSWVCAGDTKQACPAGTSELAGRCPSVLYPDEGTATLLTECFNCFEGGIGTAWSCVDGAWQEAGTYTCSP